MNGRIIFDGFGYREAFTVRDAREAFLCLNGLHRKYKTCFTRYPNGRYRVWIERR